MGEIEKAQGETQTLVKALLEKQEVVELSPELVKALGITKEMVRKAEKPPKAWWDNCVERAKSFADDSAAYCSSLWYRTQEGESTEARREAFGKADEELYESIRKALRKSFFEGDSRVVKQQERPSKEWWTRCIKAVSDDPEVKDPAAICGHLHYHVTQE